MARLTLMVDSMLADGRFVVINASREDAPVGMTFVEMTVRFGTVVDGEVESTQVGAATAVALRLESVESWRRSMGLVPFDHNAAIRLSGDGLTELRDRLARRSKGQSVFIASG